MYWSISSYSNFERADALNFVAVADIVLSVGIDEFRQADFVITVETNSSR